MPTRDYYLQQAKLLFDMAAATSDPEAAARWIKRANEYQMLAAAMPEDGYGTRGSVTYPMRQQAEQQQQQAAEQKPAEPERKDES